MAQRSATARVKLGKLTVPPNSTPSQKTLRKPSFSFNNLFSTSNESATTSKRHTYLPVNGNVSSASSSLTLPPLEVRGHLGKPVAIPRSSSELYILKVEHTAILAQNAKLRALLEAEKEYSAMLCHHLQRYHESKGRINPEKGKMGSFFYRDLKDENGNSLVPPEILGLDTMPQNENMGGEWAGDKGDDGRINIEMKRVNDEMREINMREEVDERSWKVQSARRRGLVFVASE